MHYTQLKFTCVLNRTLFWYASYPPPPKTCKYTEKHFTLMNKVLFILTQNNTMISAKYPQASCENVKNMTLFCARLPPPPRVLNNKINFLTAIDSKK